MSRRDFLAASLAGQAAPKVPVLAELFTSEGCSSCPPADELLAKLLREQPVAGAGIIVLSEHVDYWNYIGWRDPYSSPRFSQRQQTYGRRFRLNSVYTPQLVIDGQREVLGSDWRKAIATIEASTHGGKLPIGLAVHDGSARIEIESAPRAGLWLAVADERAESRVTRGENSGRRLAHVMVARTLDRIGETNPGSRFVREVRLERPGRVIVFLQELEQGKILGATTS